MLLLLKGLLYRMHHFMKIKGIRHTGFCVPVLQGLKSNCKHRDRVNEGHK